MIEESVFKDNKEIINFVKETYGINITNVERINRGSANIFSLNDNTYVLKEFQSKYTLDEIEKEITIINHLKKDSIPVPAYIKTMDNNYAVLYKERVIIIQEYIDGYTLESNEGNLEQTLECADLYGRIVKSLETLSIELPSSDIKDWYSISTFDEVITKHKNLISILDDSNKTDLMIKKDLEEKLTMLEDLKNKDFSNMEKLTVKNTHGDYNLLQFIYKDGKVKAVIDFVSACKMPIAWELIRSYSYIDNEAKNGEFNLDHFVEYVKVFNNYISLNKYDLEFMPYIYLVQILASTYGYKQYIKDHKKLSLLEFGYLRTNICRCLYKNAENISNRLIKELD